MGSLGASGAEAKQGPEPETARRGLILHVAAMIAVMAVIAVVVYDKLGVAVLKKAWLNTDQLWAAAFIVAAIITLFTRAILAAAGGVLGLRRA